MPLASADLELDAALGVVQVERDQRIAALLDLADQAADLLGMHEQLPRPRRIGMKCVETVGSGLMCAPMRYSSAAAHHDIRFADLRPAGADRLHFPAFERDAGLVALLDEIVVERLAVLDDAHEEF